MEHFLTFLNSSRSIANEFAFLESAFLYSAVGMEILTASVKLIVSELADIVAAIVEYVPSVAV